MKVVNLTFKWFSNRFKATLANDRLSNLWFAISCYFMTLLTALMMIYGNPTENTYAVKWLESAQVFMMTTFGFWMLSMALAFLLTIIYLPLPRLSVSALLITISLTIFVLLESSSGTLFSVLVGLACPLILLFIIYLFKRLWQVGHFLFLSGIILVLIISLSVFLFLKSTEPDDTINRDKLPFDLLEKGPDATAFYTYGSGNDIKRHAFGLDVDAQTRPVDASDFVHRWQANRQAFWGFSPEDFPINGRVWMPEGEGEFPVILMVHGNHSMEEYSTSGYDYLGKHLASQGFIFISVDEDFVNYSYYSGQPNDNYELRAWLLLQHLVQLQDMNQEAGHFLYHKIDFSKVGLGGHSRGGQAVAMAADYQRFFEEDVGLMQDLEDINVEAVLAISPTDKSVDNARAELSKTSYMVIQGAQDADVYQFYGEKQYQRTKLNPGSGHIKSAIYIDHANHVHFNTDWGDKDLSLPRGLFLDKFSLISPKSQQDIAKIYATAFFKRALFKEEALDEFLADPADWTSVEINNRFENSYYEPLMVFNHSDQAMPIEKAENLSIDYTKNRSGGEYSQKSLQFDWHTKTNFQLHFSPQDLTNKSGQAGENLVFTVANLAADSYPMLSIKASTTSDEKKNLVQMTPAMTVNFTHYGLFDDLFREGKYKKSWEPVYQTVKIPIDDLSIDEQGINLDFEFLKGKGRLAILEVGVY